MNMNVYSKEKDLQDSLKQVTLEFTRAKEKLSDTISVEYTAIQVIFKHLLFRKSYKIF